MCTVTDLCWTMQEPSSQLGGCQVLLRLWTVRATPPPLSLWREGFLYSTRQECYYLHNWWSAASGSFFFPFLFHFMTWQFNSVLHCIFLSFIVLILLSQWDLDCCVCCCYIWNWLEGALSEFVTLFSETAHQHLFLPLYGGWFQTNSPSIKVKPVFHYDYVTVLLAHVLKTYFNSP